DATPRRFMSVLASSRISSLELSANDVAGDPMTVVETILEIPLWVQGGPEDAPDDLRIPVGRDRHYRFPNRPIDRAGLIEDHKDAPAGIVQTSKALRAVRIPRQQVDAPSLFVARVLRNERSHREFEERRRAD